MKDSGLPPKESALFKSIVKHYETKQYKKGLKAADQVLKRSPEHGETLAMKGLILNCQEKKTEAYELVRLGVKKDIKSHVCWHVYGLLYRSDREYLQAIKCYRGALRHDPDNVQILRDLSLLQVQMRDLAGFMQTRQHLLTLKPTNRNNWFTFAVAQHLFAASVGKNLSAAVSIVEAYERTLEGAAENEYEHSEMLLYKNMVLEENGQFQDALTHLDKHKAEICDVLCWMETRAKLLRALMRHDEAAQIYKQLLRRNSEHVGYHAGLQACLLRAQRPIEQWLGESINADTEAKLRDLYAELQDAHPRSTVCRRLPLDFARDIPLFRIAATTYLLPPLRKGVPALFADIKPLYRDTAKAAAFGELFKEWLQALEAEGVLRGERLTEMPTTIMWVRVLLAQHYDQIGESTHAIELLDAAIAHTPTMLDLYLLKARAYKHAGNARAAAEWMDHARQMDLADRYLNTKCTRYMLRAGRIDDAQKTIALFTKDGDNHSNLYDMQCMWYAHEVATAHMRLGDYGKALKNFTSIDKHFNDIIEDQFDFHTYCIRKVTLRAYVKMLRFEDRIFGHHFWVEAAHGAANAYLAIFDKPMKATQQAADGDGADELSDAERKKADSKRRKAELKAKAKAEAEAKAASVKDSKSGVGKKDEVKKPVDDDPDGAALAAADDPVGKASSFLPTLQLHSPGDLRTHLLACELAMRKKRYLLVLKALRKAHALAPHEPAVHTVKVRFLHAVAADAEVLSTALRTVIADNRAEMGAPPGTQLCDLNSAYLACAQSAAANGASSTTLPAATLASAEMLVLIEPARKRDALAMAAGIDVASLTLSLACECHALLANNFKDADAAEKFRDKALARFPAALYFGGVADKPPDAGGVTPRPGPDGSVGP